MGAKILVADDSVTIQKVVGLTFSKEDFELIQARSGEEAIRKAKETRPDLMLIDLVMPDKGGYDVCQALRADPLFRDVPIILLTGTFEAFDKQEGMRVGANDFVTKPFESQVLIGKVKQLLFARSVPSGAPAAEAPPPPRVEAPPLAMEAAPPEPAPVLEPAPAIAAAPAPPPVEPAPPEVISEEKLWELIDAPAGPPAEPAIGAAPPAPSPVAPPEGPAAPPSVSAAEETTVPEFSLADVEGGETLGALELEPIDLTPIEEVQDTLAEAAAALGVEMAPPGVEAKELGLEPTPLAAPEAEPPVLEIAPAAEGGPSIFDLTPAVEVPVADAPPPPAIESPPMPEAPVAPLPILEAPEASPAAMPAAGPLAMELAPAPPPEPLAPPAMVPEPALPAGAPPGAVEAAVREATARVAEQVARQVTDKLVERIERVVWEVVPDLAEILITREIERIKAMVEEKKIP